MISKKNPRHLLVKAIAKRYPLLNARQRANLAEAIMREVAAALKRGEELAILEPLSDDSFRLSRMAVERIDNLLDKDS